VFRILCLLIAFALLFTNGAAVGHAMCQHADATTHTAALNSIDDRESSAALAEEMADKAASKSGRTADVPFSVVGLLNPASPVVRQGIFGASSWPASASWSPSDRSTAPPSRPPLH
jgi:hypothetical protein